eukprot:g6888.t1
MDPSPVADAVAQPEGVGFFLPMITLIFCSRVARGMYMSKFRQTGRPPHPRDQYRKREGSCDCVTNASTVKNGPWRRVTSVLTARLTALNADSVCQWAPASPSHHTAGPGYDAAAKLHLLRLRPPWTSSFDTAEDIQLSQCHGAVKVRQSPHQIHLIQLATQQALRKDDNQ